MQLKINLLPPEKKELIRRVRNFRLLVFQCVQLGLLAVLVFVIVYGIQWALLFNQRSEGNDSEAGQRAIVAKQVAEYQETVSGMNRRIGQVEKMRAEHISWSRLLDRLEKLVPEKLFLNHVGTDNYAVSLSGQAETRDILLDFRDRLTRDDCMTDVQMPLSNLFVQQQVDFQMTFIFKKECLKGQSL